MTYVGDYTKLPWTLSSPLYNADAWNSSLSEGQRERDIVSFPKVSNQPANVDIDVYLARWMPDGVYCNDPGDER